MKHKRMCNFSKRKIRLVLKPPRGVMIGRSNQTELQFNFPFKATVPHVGGLDGSQKKQPSSDVNY